MNKEIRSKNTYQKGKIVRISPSRVYITFVKEEEPIAITFEQFLNNCWCDAETEQIIREKMQNLESGNTLPNILV